MRHQEIRPDYTIPSYSQSSRVLANCDEIFCYFVHELALVAFNDLKDDSERTEIRRAACMSHDGTSEIVRIIGNKFKVKPELLTRYRLV